MPRFKLLASLHVGEDRSKPLKGDDGKVIPGRFADKVYKAGDVIDSEVHLADRFGHQKFQFLGESHGATPAEADPAPNTLRDQTPPPAEREAPSKATPAQLDRMSQKDLVEYAEEREIDLKGAKTREDLLKVLKTAK